MRIVCVHGANSSGSSFNYLRTKWNKHKSEIFEYTISQKMEEVVEQTIANCSVGEPVFIVGHSLGGLISYVAAEKCDNIVGFATMSSPLGGSEHANLLKWLDRSYGQVTPSGYLARTIQKTKPTKPHVCFVTSAPYNHPLIQEGDGVVSLKSQTIRPDLNYKFLRMNHFEALLSEQVSWDIEVLITSLETKHD